MKNDFVTIDLGSTQASLCLFSGEHGVQKFPLDQEHWKKVDGLPGILSSVRSEKTLLTDHPYLNDDKIVRLGNYYREKNFLDMPVKYSKTLGQDRLACAYWAWKNENISKKKPCYIIDAGTFLTVDKITDDGFEGGYIFPGIQTLLNSYSAAESLPKLKEIKWESQQGKFPQNTEAAMLNSIETMYSSSLKHLLENPALIYLTGGEGQTIGKLLIKKQREFHLSPYLIHLGLAQCFHSIQEGLK